MRRTKVEIEVAGPTSQGKWAASVSRPDDGRSYDISTFRNTRQQAKAWAMRIASEELDVDENGQDTAA